MTDPDPDRKTTRAKLTSRPQAVPRVQTALQWSRAASREYSQLESAPLRPALNALSKRVLRAAVQSATQAAPLFSQLSISNETVFLVELSFVGDADIQEINAAHRGKNKPTDVLSFSQLEGEAIPFFGDEILLGDVMISIETAARQARELNHSLERELAFLLTHGALHLCGFDHDTSARRRAMWKKQDAIVQEFNLS